MVPTSQISSLQALDDQPLPIIQWNGLIDYRETQYE
jgi:hypothetical protein